MRRPHPAKQGCAQAAQPASRAFAPPPGFLARPSAARGQALPAAVRAQMEGFFGADFSTVRVHVGSEAASIGALAFTLGEDVHFAPGQYDPDTQRGRELIGHELTHVLQQRAGRVSNPLGAGIAVVQDEALEAEAERMGKAAAQARMAPAERGGYQVVLGAYMHPDADQLPEELAGHSFVSVMGPGVGQRTWGFSPASYERYDQHRDLGRLKAGVPGRVHDDAGALERPGVRMRTFSVTREQAQAALSKVAEYQARRYPFSLASRQCSTFALDVLRAAKIEAAPGARVKRPREMYRLLK